MPCIYVKRREIPLDQDALDEAIKVALGADSGGGKGKEKEFTERITWETYGNYILARMKIPDKNNPFPPNEKLKLPPLTPRTEAMMPYLQKLSDDKMDLMVDKPKFMSDPPPVPKEVKVNVEDFHKILNSLNADTHGIRTLRGSAENMSKVLALSVNAFANAEHIREVRKHMDKKHIRYLRIFTSWIVKNQCREVQTVLDNSPIYKEMLNEMAEKKAAAAKGK